MHCRHFSMAPDEGLECVGELLWLAEAVGLPPPEAALLLFCLIDKPKGGKRAICLMAFFS